jgi:hypothetical protein
MTFSMMIDRAPVANATSNTGRRAGFFALAIARTAADQ